jgi:hypothetical protein
VVAVLVCQRRRCGAGAAWCWQRCGPDWARSRLGGPRPGRLLLGAVQRRGAGTACAGCTQLYSSWLRKLWLGRSSSWHGLLQRRPNARAWQACSCSCSCSPFVFPSAKGGRWPKVSLRMPQGACLLRVTISVCRQRWVLLRRWLACSSSSTSYLLWWCLLTACHCPSPSCQGAVSYPGENHARHCRLICL